MTDKFFNCSLIIVRVIIINTVLIIATIIKEVVMEEFPDQFKERHSSRKAVFSDSKI